MSDYGWYRLYDGASSHLCKIWYRKSNIVMKQFCSWICYLVNLWWYSLMLSTVAPCRCNVEDAGVEAVTQKHLRRGWMGGWRLAGLIFTAARLHWGTVGMLFTMIVTFAANICYNMFVSLHFKTKQNILESQCVQHEGIIYCTFGARKGLLPGILCIPWGK